jgi:hypothetical protein
MKKLLLILLFLPLLFITCKKEDATPQTLEDVIVGKKWILNNDEYGFYLSEDGGFYNIGMCVENFQKGNWIIDGSLIKYRYYQNSQEITMLYGEVSTYTSTQIKLVYYSDPTTTINRVYTRYNEVYGCTDPTADNYNASATCDNGTCSYCVNFECTYVPDDNFEAYLEANGMGNGTANDDYVLTANINTLTTLDVDYKGIEDLTGIEDFTALTTLYCSDNPLTSLDVTQNTALTALFCEMTPLTSLDVTQNTALTYLDCGYNPLTSLDVSNNLALTTLNCEESSLTSLDVSNNLALTTLICYNNPLTSLDVSNNLALTTLNCHDNQLTSLDVSNNTALYRLQCQYNQLTSLDLRNGNNTSMPLSSYYLNLTNNPQLYCIDVDDATYSTANWVNIDPQHYFSEDCSAK